MPIVLERFILICVCLALARPAWAQAVRNGDFERAAGNRFEGWEQSDAGVTIFDEAGPAWFAERIAFNSGEYTHLRLYLRIQSGVGEVWFDHVRAEGLEVVNPSFEAVEEDGSLTHWGQDNVNGTIFSADDWATDGQRSLKIAQAEEAMSRVWQDWTCQPSTDYVVEFDLKYAGLRGDAYAEVYGLTPDGGHGPILGQSPHHTGAFEDEHGRHTVRVQPAGEQPSTLSQVVTVPPNANLCAAVWIRTAEFQGTASLLVTPPDQPEEPLAQTVFREAEAREATLRVGFASDERGQVRLTLTAQGTGTVWFDNVMVTEPQLRPTPRSIDWLPASENWRIGDTLRVALPPDAPRVVQTGVAVLRAVLAKELGLTVESPLLTKEGSGEVAPLLAKEGSGEVAAKEGSEEVETNAVTVTLDEAQVAELGPEGYTLRVRRDGLTVTAAEPAGALYGLMTVRDLIARGPDGAYALACAITDAPDLPLRGAYVAMGYTFDDGLRQRLDQFVTLKLNAVLFETPAFYDLQEDPAARQAMQEMFAYCRERNLEPIPELQSFGWAHILLAKNPHLAEGTWVEGEEVTLRSEEPVPLAHPNVLITESTGITLKSADGRKTYVEGQDYRVLPGVTKFIFRPDAEPYRVARIAGGAMADGETVLASYDYASRVNSENMPYCPSEPLTRQMMSDALAATIRYLHPRYLHIGHDEPAQMGTDSRCRATGKSNALLFADDITCLRQWARQMDPKVRLMMWADALNPYHNAGVNHTAEAAELIPKDVIQCVWFYGAGEPLSQGRRSLEHFAQLGLTTTGSPWYDQACARQWSQVCGEARRRGWDCLGTIYTSWGNHWEALEVAADTSWRVPEAEDSEG